jgi:hypothetical protein
MQGIGFIAKPASEAIDPVRQGIIEAIVGPAIHVFPGSCETLRKALCNREAPKQRFHLMMQCERGSLPFVRSKDRLVHVQQMAALVASLIHRAASSPGVRDRAPNVIQGPRAAAMCRVIWQSIVAP